MSLAAVHLLGFAAGAGVLVVFHSLFTAARWLDPRLGQLRRFDIPASKRVVLEDERWSARPPRARLHGDDSNCSPRTAWLRASTTSWSRVICPRARVD